MLTQPSRTLTRCLVCGSSEIRTDEVIDRGVVLGIGLCDLFLTQSLIAGGLGPMISKMLAAASLPILNFSARRYLVFPSAGRGPWKPTYDE